MAIVHWRWRPQNQNSTELVPLALMMVRVAVPGPCLVCAVAMPGWGPGGWCCWRLFASPAGMPDDADNEGAVGDILCCGRGGDGGGVVGDVSRWLSFRVTSLMGEVWVVLWVLASLVMPTVRVSQVILGGWCVLWWSDGEGVVGVGAGSGLRLAGRRFRVWGLATPGGGPAVRLVVGWLAVLVVPVVSGVGVVLLAVLGSVVVGVAPVVVEGVNTVGGWSCCCDAAVGGAGDIVDEGVGAAGEADGEGVVGDALVDAGVLTVPWGWDPAIPGGGSRGCCWPVRRALRCWPCLVSGPSVVSLMLIVLHALHREVSRVGALWVVSLGLLLLMSWVAVAEVALLLVLLLMPVARPLWALLRFMVSLVLLMLRALLVVGVGPCVGGQLLVFGLGLALFSGEPWPVPLALTGRVRRRWCGPLVMPMVMLRVMSSVRVV